MSLELAILGFLAERPRTGYDLKTRGFGGALGAFWTADQAQIYRTLERLRVAKLVAASRKRQSSRPDQKVFELTPAGREALSDALSASEVFPPLRDPFLLQLYFSAELTDDDLLALLRARRDDCQRRLDDVRERSAEHAERHEIPARAAVLHQTALDGVAAGHKATIDWLDECIEAVEEGALPGSAKGSGQRHLFGV